MKKRKEQVNLNKGGKLAAIDRKAAENIKFYRKKKKNKEQTKNNVNLDKIK